MINIMTTMAFKVISFCFVKQQLYNIDDRYEKVFYNNNSLVDVPGCGLR